MPINHQPDEHEIRILGGSVDTEIARQRIRDQSQIALMGGPFPERENNFDDFTHVLDLPCRMGTWVSHAARANPRLKVAGLERQARSLEYAQGMLDPQVKENISLDLIGDNITQLNFPDNYFDLVNSSHVFSLVQAEEWPAFLRECLRITRPGGYIRLTEADTGQTNSRAIEQINAFFVQGIKKMGRSLSPDGRHIGVIIMLGYLLKQAGWSEIERRAYVDDYMVDPSVPGDPTARVELLINSMRQTIISQGLATPEHLQALTHEAAEDVAREDFSGIIFLLTYCARKPV